MTNIPKPADASTGEPTLAGPAGEVIHVAIPDGTSPTGSSASIAAVEPTQVRRPWRSTLRTVFQALVGLASMWGVIIAALDLPDWAWVSASLAVAAGITRVMAIPGVEAWLRRFFPWLAAAPNPNGRRRGKGQDGFIDLRASVAIIAVCVVIITVVMLFGRPGA